MAEHLNGLTRWTLFAIAIFCMAVSVVAIMFTLAQLVCVLMGWWP